MTEDSMNDVPLDGGGGGGPPETTAATVAPPSDPAPVPAPPPAEAPPATAPNPAPNAPANTTDGGSAPAAATENGDTTPAPVAAPLVPAVAPPASAPPAAPAEAEVASKAELFGAPEPTPAPAAAPPAAPAPAPGSAALFDATEDDEEAEAEADLFGALPSAGASRLAASGLLGSAGGGGLFDEVDREAEERAKREAEEKARREVEDRARMEEEERARAEEERIKAVRAQEAAMAHAQQQAAQQAQAQLQQQQQQMGMGALQQGVAGMTLQQQTQTQSLGQSMPAQQNGSLHPPQQMTQPPQSNGSVPGAVPAPPPAVVPGSANRPLSFAERSAQMQAEAHRAEEIRQKAQLEAQQKAQQAAAAAQAAQAQLQAQQAAQMQAQAQQYPGQMQQQQTQPQQHGYLGQMAGHVQQQQQPPQAGMQASYMYSTAGGPQQQQPAPLGTQQAQTLPGAMVGQQQQQYQQGAAGMHGRYYGTAQQPAAQQQPGVAVGGMGGQQVPFPQHQLQQPPQQHTVYAQTQPNPSLLAGLHNGPDPALGGVAGASGQPGQQGQAQTLNHVLPMAPPAHFEPLYGKITVSDPLLVQSHGLFAGPPHWTYAVTVRVPGDTQPRGGTTIRRRFRHFVALEDRLREICPGAILPPRPEKHPTRAIEEASARQSAQFALQRSSELEEYLNALAKHPIAGRTDVLQLFLTLQDDIGTAWPEVSSSALTRLGAVSAVTASKVAENTSTALQDLQMDQKDAGEDNADLLALAASEGLRIGSVIQAVPKIEGAVALVRDQGERSGVVGLEMSKLAKDVQGEDQDLAGSLDLLSSALLRSGRRTKRLAVELSAAAAPFVSQHKLCRYERMAFADRRAALSKRTAARNRADGRAQKLVMKQTTMAGMGRPGYMERMEMDASLSDESAVAALRQADMVGMTLQREVARVAEVRKTEWSASLKVLASSMREACTERAAIWESAREQFSAENPDYVAAAAPPAQTDMSVPTPVS